MKLKRNTLIGIIIIIIIVFFLVELMACLNCPVISMICEAGYKFGPTEQYQLYPFCIFSCQRPSCIPDPNYSPTEPALVVDHQYLGPEIKIDLVYFDKPGYVVIHADNNSEPGEVIGTSKVWEALIKNLYVGINTSKVDDRAHVILYYDNGDLKFNIEDDEPIVVNGEVLSKIILLV